MSSNSSAILLELSEAVGQRLLFATIQIGILVGLLMLFERVFRIPAATRNWMWRGLLFAFCFLVFVPFQVSLPVLNPESRVVSTSAMNSSETDPSHFDLDEIGKERGESVAVGESPLGVDSGKFNSKYSPESILDFQTTRSEARPAKGTKGDSVAILIYLVSLIWIGMVLVCGWILGRQYLCARSILLRTMKLKDGRVLKVAEELRRRSDNPRPIALRTVRGLNSPAVLGITRSVIVLPENWIESESESVLGLALAHEYAHCERRDVLWNFVAAVFAIPFFFHPLIWIILRRQLITQEVACDERAIELTRHRPKELAELLVRIVEQRVGLVSGFSQFAFMSGNVGALKERILSMKSYSFRKRNMLLVWAIGFVFAVGCMPVSLTARAADDDKEAKQEKKEKQEKKSGGVVIAGGSAGGSASASGGSSGFSSSGGSSNGGGFSGGSSSSNASGKVTINGKTFEPNNQQSPNTQNGFSTKFSRSFGGKASSSSSSDGRNSSAFEKSGEVEEDGETLRVVETDKQILLTVTIEGKKKTYRAKNRAEFLKKFPEQKERLKKVLNEVDGDEEDAEDDEEMKDEDGDDDKEMKGGVEDFEKPAKEKMKGKKEKADSEEEDDAEKMGDEDGDDKEMDDEEMDDAGEVANPALEAMKADLDRQINSKDTPEEVRTLLKKLRAELDKK